MDAEGSGSGGCEPGCRFDGIPRGQDRRQIESLNRRDVVEAAHHQDRRGHAGVPEFETLLHRGDAQLVRARGQKGQRHRNRPMAIGVGFDDSQDGGRADTSRDFLEIVAERGKVDLDDGGIQISVISASFFFTISSTFRIYASVSF